MSMTSKVNPAVQAQIVNVLSPKGIKAANAYLEFRLNYSRSTRSIQEATQKLTKEGVLNKTVESGVVYYSLAENNG